MTATATLLPSVQLFSTEGGSDKEYHAAIERETSGPTFRVTFAYGRRGSTLKPGIKIAGVPLEAATHVYSRLVSEKMGKGYRKGGAPTVQPVYVSPAGHTSTPDSIPVMLLEPVDDATPFLRSAAWFAQPKHDGHRMVLRMNAAGEVTAQNRKGLVRGFPKAWIAAVQALSSREIALDGEAIGDLFMAFDLLSLDGRDMRGYRALDRVETLASLFEDFDEGPSPVKLSPVAFTQDQKSFLYDQLLTAGCEGIVFKHFAASYVGKRTDKAVKHKFWQSATCLVIAQNQTGVVLDGGGVPVPIEKRKLGGQSSIQVAMIQTVGDRLKTQVLVNVGDVTIPPNRQLPVPGTFVEVKYLYADRASHKLIQAQIIGQRDDVDLGDCNLSTLKYKQEVA